MAMTTEDIRAPRGAGRPARASHAGRAAPAARGGEAAGRGMPLVVAAFVMGLLVPVILDLGPFRLLAHRAVLLAMTPMLLSHLFSGRAGPITRTDKLALAAILWAGLAFFVSRPGIGAIESAGMHFVEGFGGYLAARVGIRSAEDFRRFVKLLYVLILFLLPFAAIEAFTGRAILLQLIPMSHGEVWAGGPRWGLDRAQVLFAHPILYGTFVATGFALAWYAFDPGASFFKRVFLVAPVSAAVFFSLSAGALLAFMLQGALIVWDLVLRTMRDRWRLLVRLSVVGYFVLDFLSNRSPFHLLVAYGTFSSSTGYYRIVIFRNGIDDVFRNPIFGLGSNIGAWTRPGWMHGSIDNFWLYIAMTYGIPGFLLLALATYFALREATRAPLPDPVDQACRTGWAVALVGMIIAGGTVHYWTTMFAYFMFMVGAAAWMSNGGARDVAPEVPAGRRGGAGRPTPRPAAAPAPGPSGAPARAAPAAAPAPAPGPRPAVRPRRGLRGGP